MKLSGCNFFPFVLNGHHLQRSMKHFFFTTHSISFDSLVLQYPAKPPRRHIHNIMHIAYRSPYAAALRYYAIQIVTKMQDVYTFDIGHYQN